MISDHGYYTRVGAYRDRHGAPQSTDGIAEQQITVVMTDEDSSPPTIGPAVCHLPADRARELASQLLALADAAQRSGQGR